MPTKQKTAMEVRLESMQRTLKAVERQLEIAQESWRAVGKSRRRRVR